MSDGLFASLIGRMQKIRARQVGARLQLARRQGRSMCRVLSDLGEVAWRPMYPVPEALPSVSWGTAATAVGVRW